MRFVFMFGLFLIVCGMVFGIVYTIVKSINNYFLEKKQEHEITRNKKSDHPKKEEKIKSNFEIFVENYLKTKNSSSENIRVLQFIARDLMKSQEYNQESIKYNITTVIYLFLILIASLLTSFIASFIVGEHYYFTNLLIGIVDFFLLVMVGQRIKHKKYKIFENIPLTSSQAEKLTKLQVEGTVKDYIMEKASKNHGLNGADLIFLTNLV